MRDPVKIQREMQERNDQILNTAFLLFMDNKIEGTSMEDIARKAGVGKVTLYRYYSSKAEIAVALWNREYDRIISQLGEVNTKKIFSASTASERLQLVMDCLITIYQRHKEYFRLYGNLDHYMTHEYMNDSEVMKQFRDTLRALTIGCNRMYDKACIDKTLRTDIPKEQFLNITTDSMLAACIRYASSDLDDNKDHTTELLLLKEMILDFACKAAS